MTVLRWLRKRCSLLPPRRAQRREAAGDARAQATAARCPSSAQVGPARGKFNCRQHAALGSFRACCPLCVRTRSGRPSSSTRRSSGPPRKTSRLASAWRAPGLRRYPGGSRPVYAVGGRRVLKLYPTVSAPDSVTEARVLDYLNGRLPVATPELLAHGEYEKGWRYVLMSQLPGTELAAAWPAIPRSHQDRVVSEAGEMLAALHGLDPEPLHGILGPADWADFLAAQRATALERQREVKLPDPLAQPDRGFPGIGSAHTRAGAGAVAHRGDPRASDSKPRYVDAKGCWTSSAR